MSWATNWRVLWFTTTIPGRASGAVAWLRGQVVLMGGHPRLGRWLGGPGYCPPARPPAARAGPPTRLLESAQAHQASLTGRSYAVASLLLLFVLVVVAVAHRRLGPSSSATTSTVERPLQSSAVQLHRWSRPTCPSPVCQ